MTSVDFLHFLDVYTFHPETNITLQNCYGKISFYAGCCMFKISISLFTKTPCISHSAKMACLMSLTWVSNSDCCQGMKMTQHQQKWHNLAFLSVFVGWKHFCGMKTMGQKEDPPKKKKIQQQKINTIARTKQINSEIFSWNKDLIK